MSRWLARVVFMALLLGAAETRAESPPDLFPAAAPAGANALPAQTVAATGWSSRIIFANRAAQARAVRIEGFVSGPQGMLALSIARVGANGKATPLASGASVGLDPGANLDLVASANLETPGAYTVFVRLLGDDRSELTNASITVTRASDGLPSDGVVSSPAATSFFSGTSDIAMALPISGVQGRALAFTINRMTVIKVANGGESNAQLSPQAKLKCLKRATEQVGAYQVDELDSCTLALTIADVPAGDYRARFDLVGAGGGTRSVEMPFKVRASVCWFVILLVVGAVPGAFVAWWRDREQGRTQEALRVARLQQDLDRLLEAEGFPADAAAPLTHLADRLRALRVRIADGEELEGIAADRTIAAARIERLKTAALHWSNASDAERQGAGTELRDALQLIALGEAGKADAAIETLRAKLFPGKAIVPPTGGAAGEPLPMPSNPAVSEKAGIGEIVKTLATLNLLTGVILFGFFVLVAIVGLWWSDPQWGSLGDAILAILIGAGAFGTMATTLQTFRTTIQSSKG